jgi:hypothetical protein
MVAAQALHPSQANMIFSARSTGPGRRVDVTAEPGTARTRVDQVFHSKRPIPCDSGRTQKNQRARREVELASVRDCYDDPHRRSLTAAPTPHPASLPRPLPIPPATNLTAGVRGSPPDDPTRDGGPTRQPSRRGWARRVPGRRGGGRFGACAASPSIAWKSRMPAAINQRTLAPVSLSASLSWSRV